VHVIPHSHDDVGWLLTVDEYYNGTKGPLPWVHVPTYMDLQQNVKSIITTVVQALRANPQRKFSQVEMKFFSMWWNEQDD